jgi:hypothetical protein
MLVEQSASKESPQFWVAFLVEAQTKPVVAESVNVLKRSLFLVGVQASALLVLGSSVCRPLATLPADWTAVYCRVAVCVRAPCCLAVLLSTIHYT